jgi:hypothetical protein
MTKKIVEENIKRCCHLTTESSTLVLVQIVNDDISNYSPLLFSHYLSRDQGPAAKEEKEGEAAGLDCTVAVFTPNLTE